mgnify:CR=1 FL=1
MEEVRPSSLELAKALENFIYNELDIITESDWFQEKLAITLKQHFTDEEVKETPLRVNVDYVVQRLEEIVNSDHTSAVEFLEELKENLDNHEGKKNG